MTKKKRFDEEFKALETAFAEIGEKVESLRINPVQLKGAVAAAWQIEDAARNKLFVVLSGPGDEGDDESVAPDSDLVLTVEADVGQFLQLDADTAKTLMELNYTKMNLCRTGLTHDQRLVVLHRRWFEGLSSRDAFDAIAEVWNAAENLRGDLKAVTPGNA